MLLHGNVQGDAARWLAWDSFLGAGASIWKMEIRLALLKPTATEVFIFDRNSE